MGERALVLAPLGSKLSMRTCGFPYFCNTPVRYGAICRSFCDRHPLSTQARAERSH